MVRKFIHLPVGAFRRLCQPACGPAYPTPQRLGPFGVARRNHVEYSPRNLMSILDHLTEIRCPNCNMQLFRALDPVDGEIVFCSKCLAGGRWTEVITQRGTLTGNFVARQSADDFLRKIRSPNIGKRPFIL